MITAKKIEKIVKTGALHVLYNKDGSWYHHLKKFPGALFDSNGYVMFETREDYENNHSLIHSQDLNIKNKILSLPGYRKFTLEEIKKIRLLTYTPEILDSSDSAWKMLISNANIAKINKETFFSPIHNKGYQIKSVTNTTITVKREDGEDSKIGKIFFQNRINEINQHNGKIARKILSGHVAKISTIVYLHPYLDWSNNHQTVIIIQKELNQEILETVQSDLESINEENSYDFEGGSIKRLISYYERNSMLRTKAIQIHGTSCKVCQFNFEDNYGEHGYNFIEVHHLIPLHTLGKATKVNPETDMIVVCANCHRMIHRNKNKPLSIEELIGIRHNAIK